MDNYLFGKLFNLYRCGVYEGKFSFNAKEIEIWNVDPATRVQLKRIKYEKHMKETLFDIEGLYKNLGAYVNGSWEGEKVILENKKEYRSHLTFEQEINGEILTSTLWAQRKAPPIIDVVTVKGQIVAFVMPGRISSEILVLEGYEGLTPLKKYEEPALSKVEYGIKALGNCFVETKDGTKLATEVFLPNTLEAGAKFPTIVVRTCYGKSRDMHRCTHWVNRGYAFVIQDVRGRSDSDGELVPFYYEREDADDLFNWIAAQPWSDGNIGMWGASYLGYTTTAAATSGNPHLKTAISEVNVGSPFTDTARRGGALCSWPLLCWTLGQSVSNRVNFEVFGGITVNPEEVVKTRPIREIPQKIIGKSSGPWDIWAEHYHYDDFWKHCDNKAHSKNIKVPMLILSGWYDGDALGVQETWSFLTENDTPGRKIILGPWPHQLNGFRDCLDLEFGNNAIDYDYDTRIIRWFDKYLKGIENGIDNMPRATYYLVGENKWMESEDWPPKESVLTSLYFGGEGKANSMYGDGVLFKEPKAETVVNSYLYDPENPIHGHGEHVDPYICNEDLMRQDILVFSTETLKEDVAVAGNVSAKFFASSSAVDTDFFVRLTDVDEKGVTRYVSDNIIRAEFRKGIDKPCLLTPGEVEEFNINMHFAGFVFKKGHKIRVDIRSSECMQFFPNSNTGISPYDDPAPVVALQKIYTGSEYPSCVKLPILYGEIF